MAGYSIITIYAPVKSFENRLIFGEDIDNHKVGCFFPDAVYKLQIIGDYND